jgi:hypothetical protein
MSKLNEELFQTCVKLEVLLGLKTNFVVVTDFFYERNLGSVDGASFQGREDLRVQRAALRMNLHSPPSNVTSGT